MTFSAGAANVMSAGTVVMQQTGFETFNITGTDYADMISTAAGNDYVSAGLGNDRVNVGTGRGWPTVAMAWTRWSPISVPRAAA